MRVGVLYSLYKLILRIALRHSRAAMIAYRLYSAAVPPILLVFAYGILTKYVSSLFLCYMW